MPLIPKMIQYFSYRRATFSVLHHKQETTTYFPGIEWEYPYLFILELPVFIEEVHKSEKKFIFFLIGKTRQSYFLYDIDEGVHRTIIVHIFKEVVESLENLEIRTVYILTGDFVLIKVQKIGKDRSVFIFYRQGLEGVADKRIQPIIPFVCLLPCGFNLIVGIFHAGEYHTVIQWEFPDSSTVHS